MKKIISIILVIVLAFSLCGCISCNCNCGCGEKKSIEAKQEMLTSSTEANSVEIIFPSPTSIPTPAPTPMIVNGVEINMDPNAWAGFDRDPYLG